MSKFGAAQRKHSCILVYPDGVHVPEPRYTWQISVWIKSNITFHPSAAIFVDGMCRYHGHLTDEQIASALQKINSPESVQ